jgi:Ca2+-binding RTX toxin-like protein
MDDLRFMASNELSFASGGISTRINGINTLAFKIDPPNVVTVPPSFYISVHEIGHAMGLSHTQIMVNRKWQEASGLTEITTLDTLMSYNQIWNSLHSPQEKTALYDSNGVYLGEAKAISYGILDIQALQYIYGENHTVNADNTTYKYTPEKLNFFDTIWDGGGNDTLDFSAFNLGSVVSLNGGTRSSIYVDTSKLAPEKSHLNSIAYDEKNAIDIAYGADIENINGTQGNDVIYGNELNNIIKGNNGNDTLYGGKGNDILYGGSGVNTLNGGDGNDVIYIESNSVNHIYGRKGDDKYVIGAANAIYEIFEEKDSGLWDSIELSGLIYANTTPHLPENVENLMMKYFSAPII